MTKFEEIRDSLKMSQVLRDKERAFFARCPWVDPNADFERLACWGRLSLWERPDGSCYLVVGLPDDSPLEFLPNV